MQYPDRRIFRLLLLLMDLCVLMAAFQLAVETRVGLNRFYGFAMTRQMALYLVPPMGLILLLWIPMSGWLELYRPRRGRLLGAVRQVVESVVSLAVLTIVVTFFVRHLGEGFSRSFVLFFSAYSFIGLTAARILLRIGLSIAQSRGFAQERIAIAGEGLSTKKLAEHLEATAHLGVELCGVVTTGPGVGAGVLGNPVPVLGTIAEAGALINTHRLDRVIAVDSEIDRMDLQTLAATCARMGVALHRLPAHSEILATRLKVHQMGDLSLLEVHGIQFSPGQERAKRAFDLVVGASLLITLSPLLAVLSLLVKVTSRGPVLYVAPRVGKGGRHFPFYKFRSMVVGADARRAELGTRNEKRGHLFKIKDDPRLTRVGRFMRRYSIDELPQLLNVLKGDMSLVGPRPLPAADLDPDGMSSEHVFWARERTRVLPGITGLWQVRGRAELDFDDMIRHDVAYARTWSIRQDIRILVLTLPAVLRGRGAY